MCENTDSWHLQRTVENFWLYCLEQRQSVVCRNVCLFAVLYFHFFSINNKMFLTEVALGKSGKSWLATGRKIKNLSDIPRIKLSSFII